MKSTRKKTELAMRRQQVAEMYLRGKYQTDIASEMNVNQATISRDLAELRKEWLDRSINHIDQRKAIELAKIDQLEITYWDAWERSKEDSETETVEKIGKADKDGKPTPDRIKQNKRKEGQTGNPSFLAGVQWCINKRCEILGLDAPKKNELAGPGGGPIETNIINVREHLNN